MSVLEQLAQSVIEGKINEAVSMTQQALAEEIDAVTIIQDGLAAGMNEVGRRFKAGEYFLPEVMVSAKSMSKGVELLEPYLAGDENSNTVGTFMIGTVKGDVHDIGKNILIMMFQGAGFKVIDLGVDVPPEKFVQAAVEQKPDIVGLCALLSTTMPMQAKTIAAFEQASCRDQFKIMVGGAPVSQDWSDKITADGYAADAIEAVDMAKELLGIA